MNIRDRAKTYVPPPKITDLPRIPLDVEIFDDGKGENPEDNKEYSYSYMIINDKEVRVPESVISQLQEQIKENESMVAFKVTKKGEGKQTRYMVVPIFG